MTTKPCYHDDKTLLPWRQNPVTMTKKPCYHDDKTLLPWRQNPVTMTTKPCYHDDKTMLPWQQNPVTMTTRTLSWAVSLRISWHNSIYPSDQDKTCCQLRGYYLQNICWLRNVPPWTVGLPRYNANNIIHDIINETDNTWWNLRHCVDVQWYVLVTLLIYSCSFINITHSPAPL